jgi:tRNA(Ile)-lysidine synthase
MISLKLPSKAKKYLLAVSGGVDSMVMATLFWAEKIPIHIAHMNFQLRGEESAEDEAFIRNWCTDHEVPFHTESVNTEQIASETGNSIQETARNLRYAFFYRLLETHQLDYIATAHHADDTLETVVFHFLRGTGLKGMTGIPYRNDRVVRPLLEVQREAIQHYALEYQVVHREDSSNQSTKYSRNKIRLQILPKIEEVFPGSDQRMLQSIAHLQGARYYFEQEVNRIRKKLFDYRKQDIYIPLRLLDKMPHQETLLLELLHPFGFHTNQISEVLSLLESTSGRRVESSTHRIIRSREFLILTTQKTCDTSFILLEPEDNEVHTADFVLRVKSYAATSPISKDNLCCTVNKTALEYPLILRRWRLGDYLYPFGMNKKKKVARVLIDAKIPLHDKEKIWVLESNKKIVWVLGLKTDERFRVQPQDTERLEFVMIPHNP